MGKITTDQRDRIVEMFDSGVRVAEIAREVGCSALTLRRFLNEHYPDRQREKPSTNLGGRLYISEEAQAAILRLDDERLPYAKIAKAVGVMESTVIRFIHNHHPERKRARFGKRESAPNWKGGSYVHRGYRYVVAEPGDELAQAMKVVSGRATDYVLEHRLVMARRLGRPLRKNETVHHIDGNTQNNADANLQLRQGRHGKHVVLCCRDCGSSNVGPAPIAEAA